VVSFTFSAVIWRYQGNAAWFFVTLPKVESEEIKFFSRTSRRGWRSVKVIAMIGDLRWSTSVFPDSKSGSYFLPIKSEVRVKQNITAGDSITIQLTVDLLV
jgi:hypothetical protein